MPASTKYRGMSHECHDVSLNCHGPSWSWNGIPRMKWNVTRNVASVMENHGTWDQYLLQATMEQPCDKYHGPCCHGQLPSCHHRTCQHVIQVPCLVPSSAGPKQCSASAECSSKSLANEFDMTIYQKTSSVVTMTIYMPPRLMCSANNG